MAQAAIAAVASRWQTHFDGHLITQEHAEYDRWRRVWNGMIDRRPALIARCSTPSDASKAVKSRVLKPYPSASAVVATLSPARPSAKAAL